MTESISHPFIVIVIISKKLLQILLKFQYPLTPDQRQTQCSDKMFSMGRGGGGGGGRGDGIARDRKRLLLTYN